MLLRLDTAKLTVLPTDLVVEPESAIVDLRPSWRVTSILTAPRPEGDAVLGVGDARHCRAVLRPREELVEVVHARLVEDHGVVEDVLRLRYIPALLLQRGHADGCHSAAHAVACEVNRGGHVTPDGFECRREAPHQHLPDLLVAFVHQAVWAAPRGPGHHGVLTVPLPVAGPRPRPTHRSHAARLHGLVRPRHTLEDASVSYDVPHRTAIRKGEHPHAARFDLDAGRRAPALDSASQLDTFGGACPSAAIRELAEG
mmetsp:Transcript_118883/g.296567  ORF Transcript_118883/g.296567 Transcript_118883/m.296567 type:complete len:256 (-) Transcript_118883:309-1076(-)